MEDSSTKSHHEPWNKGELVGQKAPFKLKEIWAKPSRDHAENASKCGASGLFKSQV